MLTACQAANSLLSTCRIATPQHAAAICDMLGESQCIILPSVGHLSNEEAPAALSACLVTFCKQRFVTVMGGSGDRASI